MQTPPDKDKDTCNYLLHCLQGNGKIAMPRKLVWTVLFSLLSVIAGLAWLHIGYRVESNSETSKANTVAIQETQKTIQTNQVSIERALTTVETHVKQKSAHR